MTQRDHSYNAQCEAMPDKQHAALVRQAIEAIWNRGEFDIADVLFATNYRNHDRLITDLVHGLEAIKISAALYRTAFPKHRWTAHKAFTESQSEATITQGTLTGTLTSRPASWKAGFTGTARAR